MKKGKTVLAFPLTQTLSRTEREPFWSWPYAAWAIRRSATCVFMAFCSFSNARTSI